MRAMRSINGFFYYANSIAITAVLFKPGLSNSQTSHWSGGGLDRFLCALKKHQLHRKPRGDLGGYRLRFDFRRIGGVARRPDAGLLALDRERTVHQQLMLDVETRTAELAHSGCQLDDVAEPRRREKARAGIDQGDAHDAEGRAELVRLHAECRLEEGPRAPIEELEEPAVEDDAGRVAMAPFDHELPSVDETGHRVVCRRAVSGGRIEAQLQG